MSSVFHGEHIAWLPSERRCATCKHWSKTHGINYDEGRRETGIIAADVWKKDGVWVGDVNSLAKYVPLEPTLRACEWLGAEEPSIEKPAPGTLIFNSDGDATLYTVGSFGCVSWEPAA